VATFSLQQKHADLDQHNAARMAEIARESADDVPLLKASAQLSRLGDPATARGVPIVGGRGGYGGAIRGTRPGDRLR
jgi:hypothetical protein